MSRGRGESLRRRLAAGLLLAFPAVCFCARADGWYSVRLLAKPIVQPAGEVAPLPDEPRPVVVRTGASTARCFLSESPPAQRLESLAGVRRLDVDGSVRSLPAGFFAGSPDLRVVDFEGKIRRIGPRAFAGSTNLVCIVLHEALSTLVAEDAFSGCATNLACVYPFSPTLTAQDGDTLGGEPLFARILFRRRAALEKEFGAAR